MKQPPGCKIGVLENLGQHIRHPLAVRIREVHACLLVRQELVHQIKGTLLLNLLPAVQGRSQGGKARRHPQGQRHQGPNLFPRGPGRQGIENLSGQKDSCQGSQLRGHLGTENRGQELRRCLLPDFHGSEIAGKNRPQRNFLIRHDGPPPGSICSAPRRGMHIFHPGPSGHRGFPPPQFGPAPDRESGHRTGWRPAGGR